MTSCIRRMARHFYAAILLSIMALASPQAVAQLPDLTVSNVSLPAAAEAGNSFVARWTVRNIGAGAAASSLLFDYVYLSADTTLNVLTDDLIGVFIHAVTLVPGAVEDDSTDIFIQPGVNGNYYAFVVTDGASLVTESNELNNSARSSVIAIFGTSADLQVLSVTAPLSSSVTAQITISYTVRNNGPDGLTNLSWFDEAVLSLDTLKDGNDLFLGGRSVSQTLPAGTSYTEQILGTIPSGISGSYYVLVTTSASTSFADNNSTNNTAHSAVVSISSAAPDLAVSQVQVPALVTLNEDFQITYTLSNVGDTTTGSRGWTDAYYLSADSVYDGSDTLLGAQARSLILNPGQSAVVTAILTSPPNLLGGNYHIIVRADAFSSLGDPRPDNNIAISRAYHYAPNVADLIVTSLQFPPTAFAGQQIELGWVVKNQGTRGTLGAQWYDLVYLSPTPVLDTRTAIIVGYSQNVSYLNPGDSYAGKISYTLPVGITGGYYLFVITDGSNSVTEAIDTNNTLRSQTELQIAIPPLPDLQITSLISPATAFSGQRVTLSWTVGNFGPAATLGGWSDAVYLSADTVLNTSTDTFLGSGGHLNPLKPDSTSPASVVATIPNAIFGTYYLFVVADRYEQVYENIFDANNTRRSGPLQIILSPPPDFLVTSITTPPSANSGAVVRVQYSVMNQGAGSPFEGGWVDRMYFSRLSVFNRDSATLIRKENLYRQMRPDSSYTLTRDVRLPDGISGTYYLYVHADADSNIYEFNADNNNIGRSAAIGVTLSPWPDLQVTGIQLSGSARAGDKLPFSYTASNRGAGGTRDSLWVDRVYMSTRATWDTAAKLLYSVQRTRALAQGESYQVTGSVSIPTDIQGTAYLYVYTDASGSVYEYTDEGNNVRQSLPLAVEPYPPIDIQVTSLSAPGSGASGKPILVSYTATNGGIGRTLKTDWTDLICLSADTVYTAGADSVIGTIPRSGGLNPGESYTRNLSLKLPQGASGDYRLLVVVDTSNGVDATPGNNRRSTPISVSLTPSPDLVVTTVALLDLPVAGQMVRVVYTVRNNGPGRAEAAGWSDGIFLSNDSLPGPSDRLCAARSKSLLLESGTSYTDTARFEIPSYAFGSQYFMIQADYHGSLYEGTEGNNFRALQAQVVVQPPADLVVESIQVPSAAAAGQDVSVSWIVRNLGPNQVRGTMRDAVYFSDDTLWTVEDPLLGIFERTIDIPPSGSAAMSARLNMAAAILADSLGNLTKPVPGIIPGQYYVIVRADVRNNINETNEGNNQRVSTGSVSVGIPVLPIGVTVTSPLPEGRSLFYRVAAPGETSLRFTLTSDATRPSNEMFVRFGQAPSPGAYDFLYDLPQSPSQTITVPATQPGDYYVLLRSREVPFAGQTISLRADTLNFQLNRITPTRGGNAGEVTLKLQGARFLPEFQAYLRPAGVADTSRRIWSTKVLFGDAATAYATFDLRHAAPGSYDVVFRIPSDLLDVDTVAHKALLLDTSRDAVLPSAFTVVAGGSPRVEIRLLTPTRARRTFEFPLTLEVANTGENDAPAPVILITSPSKSPIGLKSPVSPAASPEIQVLVLGPEGRRDVLAPGQITSVRVYSLARDFPSSAFLVQDLTTTGLPLDWDSMEPYYRDQHSATDWTETWRTFKELVGPTWESFHAALRRAAVDRAPSPTERAYAADNLLSDLFARARIRMFQRYLAQNPPLTPPRPLAGNADPRDGFSPASVMGSCDCESGDAAITGYLGVIGTGAHAWPGYPGNALNHFIDLSGTEQNFGEGDGITEAILANDDVQDFIKDVMNNLKIILRIRRKAAGMACSGFRIFSLDELFAANGTLQYLSQSFNFGSGNLGITLGRVPGQGLPKPRLKGTVMLLKTCEKDCDKTKATLDVVVNLNLHIEDIYDFCPGGGAGQGRVSDLILNAARQLEACGYAKEFKITIDASKTVQFSMSCEETGCEEPDDHRKQPPSPPCSDPDPCANYGGIAAGGGSLLKTTAGGYSYFPPDCPACHPDRYDVPTVAASDPNEMVGPKGYGDQKWVAIRQTLPYTIRFENDPKLATAPAQVVTITQKLDTTADARTVRLTSLGFARFVHDIQGGRATYSTRLDVRDSLNLFVDVTAGVDVTTNSIFATFSSVNPVTGEPPSNPLSGFLAVNDSTGRGEGYFGYTLRPRTDSHTGDSLRAKAAIVFDNNAAIDTPPHFNLIDAGTPVSRVRVLPATIDSGSFRIAWGGKDDTLASGLKAFTIYVSNNDTTYAPWLKDVTDTTAVYQGEWGKTYRFFSVAADRAGNVEALKTVPDATTTITGVDGAAPTPTSYALLQNYPNPFNPSTIIRFDVPERAFVRLTIYNVLGQLVMTLVDGQLEAGAHKATFDARRLATGMYIYRMRAGSFTAVRKMLLVK